MYREACEARLRVEGGEKPGPLDSLDSLANCMGSERRLHAKAQPLFEELALKREVLAKRKRVRFLFGFVADKDELQLSVSVSVSNK